MTDTTTPIATAPTPETASRDHGGRFLPGVSPNPLGRPKGRRHLVLQMLDDVGDDAAAAVWAKAGEMAKAGDTKAIELVLRRVHPEPKGRLVQFQLRDMRTTGDVVAAQGDVARAVADGVLTPEGARDVSAIVENLRKSIETHDMGERLERLERQRGMTGGRLIEQ